MGRHTVSRQATPSALTGQRRYTPALYFVHLYFGVGMVGLWWFCNQFVEVAGRKCGLTVWRGLSKADSADSYTTGYYIRRLRSRHPPHQLLHTFDGGIQSAAMHFVDDRIFVLSQMRFAPHLNSEGNLTPALRSGLNRSIVKVHHCQ
jgi:hypothetical protein